MAAPGKIKKLTEKFGEPAADVILRMLNDHKSLPMVARELDMDVSSLFRFVDSQNIKKEVRWIKSD